MRLHHAVLALAMMAGGVAGEAISCDITTVDSELQPYLSCIDVVAPEPCGVDVECPVCSASAPKAGQRVRKAWHLTSDEEKARLFAAIQVMKYTPTAEGQALYGPKFYTFDYFAQLHMSGVMAAGGGPYPKVDGAPHLVDYSHIGDHFIPWHSAFVFVFEECMKAIDPHITAIPYPDFRLGLQQLFDGSDLSFGSRPGTGEGHGVVDGAFGNWTVGPGDPTLPFFYPGGLRSGPQATDYIQRYPHVDPDWDWSITEEMYQACATTKTMQEWQSCIEKDVNNYYHSGAHFFIGGFMDPTEAQENDFCVHPIATDAGMPALSFTLIGTCKGGDMSSLPSGPNDPVFMFIHASVDMNWHQFMHNNADSKDSYYHFQASGGNVNPEYTYLTDIVNPPFWPIIPDMSLYFDDAPAAPATYADIVCRFGPGVSPYVYDAQSSCTDSPTWYKKGSPSRDCAWVAQYPQKRCDAKGADRNLAYYGCPFSCAMPCADTSAWYKKDVPAKDCAWVASYPAKRCLVKGWDGSFAADSCPTACA